MQRFAAVWHASPQKMVGVLFALLLAAMMAVGSGANFNSTSANPGNVVTAGNLSHINSKDTAALLTVTKIKPGESRSRHGRRSPTRRHRRRLLGRPHDHRRHDADAREPVRRAPQPQDRGHDRRRRRALRRPAVRDEQHGRGQHGRAVGATHQYKFTVTFLDGGPNGADNEYKGGLGTTRTSTGRPSTTRPSPGGRTPCPGPPPAGSPPRRPAGWGVSSCWRASWSSRRPSCRACSATSATCWSGTRWSRRSTRGRWSSTRSCPPRRCAAAT